MKIDPLVAAGLGVIGGAALYALVLQPEKPCAVVWAGTLTPKTDVIPATLANNGFTITSGTLKQETMNGVTVFMVNPSDLPRAQSLISALR
jgi:hypothetical protein